jgi:hypothetical protein
MDGKETQLGDSLIKTKGEEENQNATENAAVHRSCSFVVSYVHVRDSFSRNISISHSDYSLFN